MAARIEYWWRERQPLKQETRKWIKKEKGKNKEERNKENGESVCGLLGSAALEHSPLRLVGVQRLCAVDDVVEEALLCEQPFSTDDREGRVGGAVGCRSGATPQLHS